MDKNTLKEIKVDKKIRGIGKYETS